MGLSLFVCSLFSTRVPQGGGLDASVKTRIWILRIHINAEWELQHVNTEAGDSSQPMVHWVQRTAIKSGSRQELQATGSCTHICHTCLHPHMHVHTCAKTNQQTQTESRGKYHFHFTGKLQLRRLQPKKLTALIWFKAIGGHDHYIKSTKWWNAVFCCF